MDYEGIDFREAGEGLYRGLHSLKFRERAGLGTV
jgi:hypothetical protein